MEINITIIIQALILLMLFISLSYLLFQPLKNLANSRLKLINDEKKNIAMLKDIISEQKYYIDTSIFFIRNKINRKVLYSNINNTFQIKEYEKRVSLKLC